ncbi:major facilitator superfamily domain-containing protein [Dipodascopsis uninucleata]
MNNDTISQNDTRTAPAESAPVETLDFDQAVTRPSLAYIQNAKPIDYASYGVTTPPHEESDVLSDAAKASKYSEAEVSLMEKGYSPRSSAPTSGRSSPAPIIVYNDNSLEKQQPDVDKKFGINDPPKNKYRVIACTWIVFCLGMSDGAIGALLPYMEDYYHINYAEVSTIWMANSIGFIITAVFSHMIYTRIGRAGMLTLGPALLTVMFGIIVAGPPFPVIVIGFLIGGLGMAMTVAQVNVFLSYLLNTESWFGLIHGGYGIGATLSPLISTVLVSRGMQWSHYYAIPVAISAVGTAFSAWALRGCDRDLGTQHMLRKYKKRQQRMASDTTLAVAEEDLQKDFVKEETTIYHEALHNKVTWLAAAFILLYQGAEVSLGGWIDTYLIEGRGGVASQVGYVSCGFWGGVTLGRLVLNQVITKIIRPRLAIYVLLSMSTLLVILTWVIPNVIASAVMISLAGLFIGPIYPTVVTFISNILPRRIQSFSLTITTAFGSTGGALWPFITGLIAQSRGTYVVNPIAIGLFAAMIVMWYLLPAKRRN